MVRSSIWATCWRRFEEFDSERNVKYDLVFDPPLMNAAGGLGFTPPPRKEVDLSQLGAFIAIRRRTVVAWPTRAASYCTAGPRTQG